MKIFSSEKILLYLVLIAPREKKKGVSEYNKTVKESKIIHIDIIL